jgi:transaldolase
LTRPSVGDPLPPDGGDVDAQLDRFAQAGVDTSEVAAQLQRDAAASFVTAWNELMDRIEAQTTAVG